MSLGELHCPPPSPPNEPLPPPLEGDIAVGGRLVGPEVVGVVTLGGVRTGTEEGAEAEGAAVVVGAAGIKAHKLAKSISRPDETHHVRANILGKGRAGSHQG
jgi:hypothetical protein